jgi:hypothetical protein
MNVRTIVSVACVLVFSCAVSRADNPVFNDLANENVAWFVGYDKARGNGNKQGDLAIRLRLKSENGSDEQFTGTLVRYDRVAKVQGKDCYIQRRTGGTIVISGRASKLNAGTVRKPLRFKATGTYGDGSQVRTVTIQGVYHAGKKSDPNFPRNGAAFKNARLDDRLVIHIVDKVKGGGKTAGTGSHVIFASTVSGAQDDFIRLVADPCEEEPDIDILSEEICDAATPMYIP